MRPASPRLRRAGAFAFAALLALAACAADPAAPPAGKPLPEGGPAPAPYGYSDLCKRTPEALPCRR
jgi:predicted transglutaminase-like cysteine proteinase